MVSRRTATWLFAWIAWALAAPGALAQVPSDSNLDYPSRVPMHEHGSAPWAAGEPSLLGGLWPFGPGHVGTYAQPFAPAETSTYGNGPRPHEGWFFQYERVFWSFSKPKRAIIGSPTATGAGVSFPNGQSINLGIPILEQGIPTILTNTVDTGFMEANGAWGNRWEIGYLDDTNRGWLVSILDHVKQSQYREEQSVIMQFDDPGNQLLGTDFSALLVFAPQPLIYFVTYGKIPIRFDVLQMQNITYLNGVELTRMYRAPRLHKGGYFELLYGVRWLQLQDAFIVEGFNSLNSDITPPIAPNDVIGAVFYFNPLADSRWATRATNNMIGPQIGFRWFRQHDRWITSVEGRFLAAANFQAIHQSVLLGNNVLVNSVTTPLIQPLIFQGLGSNSTLFYTTFAPVGEIRVNATFQATRSIALTVGYTGMVIGNVSRASNRIDYSGPNLISILPGGNHQLFYANGINFGVQVNR